MTLTPATGASETANSAGTTTERTKARGEALVAKIKELVHEGNVRRIVVKNDEGHAVLEIPVNAGVVAAVIAPLLTAVGAIAALAKDWTIEVHRTDQDGTDVA